MMLKLSVANLDMKQKAYIKIIFIIYIQHYYDYINISFYYCHYFIFLGTYAEFTKQASLPQKTVHFSDLQCTGDEDCIKDCTQATFFLELGKQKRNEPGLKFAGVTCYTPNCCVEPPAGGTNCLDGVLRLLGDKNNGEGVLEYC